MASELRLTTLANNAGTESVDTTYVINGSAKAWVNFNGSGTIAARDSLNLSSLTDNGTGNYTVNFSNAMNNNDYSSLSATRNRMTGSADTYSATTSKRIEMFDGTGTADDTDSVNFGLLGDLA